MAIITKTLLDFTGLSTEVTKPFIGDLGEEIKEVMTGFLYARTPPGTTDVQLNFDHILDAGEASTLEGVIASHTGSIPDTPTILVNLEGVDTSSGTLKTSSYKPTDSNDPVGTHNFCDKTTWVQGSLYWSGALERTEDFEGEIGRTVYRAPDGSGGYLSGLIDVTHGKCGSLEHFIDRKYVLDVYSDGVLREVDNIGIPYFYACNYSLGLIEFHEDPGALTNVTAELYYASSSIFEFKPIPLMKALLHSVELQISEDSKFLCNMGRGNYVYFRTLLYINDANGSPFMVLPFDFGWGEGHATRERRYRSKYHLLEEANRFYVIPKSTNPVDIVDIPMDIHVHGWEYIGVKELNSIITDVPGYILTSVLQVGTQQDLELQGSYAKPTLYVINTPA